MKKGFLFLFFFYFYNHSFCQDSIPHIIIDSLSTNYKDFIIVGNDIYTISKGDSLVIWDINSDRIKFIKPSVNTIAKTNNNRLYATTNQNEIIYSKNGKKWKKKGKYLGDSYYTIINDKNKPVFITSKGILFDKKYYTPKNKDRIYKPKYKNPDSITQYLRKPKFPYIDNNGILWLNFMNGASTMYPWFFDTNRKELFKEEYLFIDVEYNQFKNWNRYQADLIEAFPNKIKVNKNDTLFKFPAQIPIYNNVQGITEDNKGNLYISQFGGHMTADSGISIYSETIHNKFYKDNYLKDILDYHIWTNSRNGKSWEVKNLIEFLGPITYNKFDDNIYFFTNRGFFKLINDGDKYSKVLYILPSGLNRSDGEYQLGGYTMVIKKMEFIDAKRFVFLSSINGIGYYDGTQMKYYK